MKKMEMATCILALGAIGMGAYVFLNKSTKNKADKVLNNLLDKANSMTAKMGN